MGSSWGTSSSYNVLGGMVRSVGGGYVRYEDRHCKVCERHTRKLCTYRGVVDGVNYTEWVCTEHQGRGAHDDVPVRGVRGEEVGATKVTVRAGLPKRVHGKAVRATARKDGANSRASREAAGQLPLI